MRSFVYYNCLISLFQVTIYCYILTRIFLNHLKIFSLPNNNDNNNNDHHHHHHQIILLLIIITKTTTTARHTDILFLTILSNEFNNTKPFNKVNQRKTIVNSWVRCLENNQLVITSGFPTVNFRK